MFELFWVVFRLSGENLMNSSEYNKKRRIEFKKKGFCILCQKNKVKKSCACCQICLTKNRNMKLRWRKLGLCIFCGKGSGGLTACVKCSHKKRTLYLSSKDRVKALQDLRDENIRCRICGSKEHNGQNWAIDHNHKTNRYRGLLCFKCNTGLGMFRDEIKILKKAILYLENQ